MRVGWHRCPPLCCPAWAHQTLHPERCRPCCHWRCVAGPAFTTAVLVHHFWTWSIGRCNAIEVAGMECRRYPILDSLHEAILCMSCVMEYYLWLQLLVDRARTLAFSLPSSLITSSRFMKSSSSDSRLHIEYVYAAHLHSWSNEMCLCMHK